MFDRLKYASTRSKVLVAALVLLLIIVIILFLLQTLKSRQAEQPQQGAEQQQPVSENPIAYRIPQTPNGTAIADAEAISSNGASLPAPSQDLLFLARSFVERFGSYSNQGGFKSFEDLQPFMSAPLEKWAEGYKKDLSAQHSDLNRYYGIETKAISANTTSQDEQTSTILVKTQRQEFDNVLSNPRLFYQDVRLELLKDGEVWKVKGIYFL